MSVRGGDAMSEPRPLTASAGLYSGTRWVSGVRVVCHPRVKSWAGWPDDVRDTLHAWNRERRLSFVGVFVGWQHTFKCLDCERFIDPSGTTACRLDGVLICDDCIVACAREQDGSPDAPTSEATPPNKERAS